MMISPKYLIYHDLIGFEVTARLKSKSKVTNFLDVGVVIDDTQNMLITEKNNVRKKFIKKDYDFRFKLNNGTLEVNGTKILGIPENRLRNLKKKKW
ncbi:MAG: ribonuclease P protein subunit [Candidatus Hermodarchaeota archaeon]